MMISIQQNEVITENKNHNLIPWLLLGGLLFLRLPFLVGIRMLMEKPADWLESSFQIGTYLLTALLIWWERDRLADFHIDRLALSIIILFKPIETLILMCWGGFDTSLTFPHWGSLIVWAIAAGLFIALWRSHLHLPGVEKSNWKWFVIGIGVGIGVAILLGYPMSLQVSSAQLTYTPHYWDSLAILAQGIPSFFYQLGYAAVSEEPLFRGFLWGYLVKAGWRNIWILLFQAGLFVSGHLYYFNTYPISFWIIVPTGALVLGLVAWRSRSIAASMATHAAMNALGMTIGIIFASFRF